MEMQSPSNTHSTNMKRPKPGHPWTPTVNVILNPQDQTFQFQSDDLTVGPNNEITFNNDGQPGFRIKFHLADPRYNFRFVDDKETALWSTKEPVCPSSAGQWRQFAAESVTDDGLDLIVRNLNADKCQFGYALHVTDDQGATTWRLDPIGSNQNGNTYR